MIAAAHDGSITHPIDKQNTYHTLTIAENIILTRKAARNPTRAPRNRRSYEKYGIVTWRYYRSAYRLIFYMQVVEDKYAVIFPKINLNYFLFQYDLCIPENMTKQLNP